MNKLTTGPRTIDQQPSLKGFALTDILSLFSGLLLPGSGPRQVHDLVGYLTGTAPDQAASQAKDAQACLGEQLLFLKTLDFTPLHGALKTGTVDDRLKIWLDTQLRNFGAEHYLMPRERWQRRRNSHKL